MECECCSRVVSPQAEACSSWGHPVQPTYKRFIAWLLFAPVSLLVLAGLSRMVWPPLKPFDAQHETRNEIDRRISDEIGVPIDDVRYAVDEILK